MQDHVTSDVLTHAVLGVGSAVGERIEDNHALATRVTNFDPDRAGCDLDTWVRERFGITTRALTDRLPSDLATDAARIALERAGRSSEDIDLLVLNTATGDHRQPTTATAVQGLLGMRPDSFALEINMPCAGIIYGLELARSLLAAGQWRTALVIGVDKMSDLVDPHDFIMAGMFGDGAGAAVVGHGEGPDLHPAFLRSAPDPSGVLRIEAGGSAAPLTPEAVADGKHYLRMQGPETASFIDRAVREAVHAVLAGSGMSVEDIEAVIPHQASRPLVLAPLLDLGFSEDRVHFTLDRFGNTSAASLLVTLDDWSAGRITGGPYLLVGMGGGLNWGGVLIGSRDS